MIKARFEKMGIEEVANTLTHGFGLVLSIAGFCFLLMLAVINGDGWNLAASLVYGFSLIILYAASTFYHGAVSPELKRKLQIVDHCCIYLLIAGSYTPFMLVVLRDTFGFTLLGIVWAFAVFGITMKLLFFGRFNLVGVASYLVMGWIGLLAIYPLYNAIGVAPLGLVIGGGVSYSLGVIFFGWHSLRHHHAIFHLFVLAGSILHFAAISIYVLK